MCVNHLTAWCALPTIHYGQQYPPKYLYYVENITQSYSKSDIIQTNIVALIEAKYLPNLNCSHLGHTKFCTNPWLFKCCHHYSTITDVNQTWSDMQQQEVHFYKHLAQGQITWHAVLWCSMVVRAQSHLDGEEENVSVSSVCYNLSEIGNLYGLIGKVYTW